MALLRTFSAARDGVWRVGARGYRNVPRAVVDAVNALGAYDIALASARSCPQRADFGLYVWYRERDEGLPLTR
jgi:hypothetical protein